MNSRVGDGLVVQRIGGHRIVGDNATMQMVWRGFEEEDDSFNMNEDAEYVLKVVPNLAKRYLRKLVRAPSTKARGEGVRLVELLGLTVGDVNDGPVGAL